jgi:hypothetical protein
MMAFEEESNEFIAKMINKSSTSVCHWRKDLGLLPRNYKFKCGKHKEKEIVENYDFGWALGMFATDGSLWTDITKSYKRVSLSCTISDKQNLINFFNVFLADFNEDDITIDTKLKNTYAKFPKCSYVCSCPNFIKLIEKYLIFNKKTYDIQINRSFNDTSEEFKMGFLKGCIDGDGHIGEKFVMGIVSASKNFILDLQSYFKGRFSKRKQGDYWDIIFRKEECVNLFQRGLIQKEDRTLLRKTQKILKHITNYNAEPSIEYSLTKNGEIFKFKNKSRFSKEQGMSKYELDRLLKKPGTHFRGFTSGG